jgi:hypothetical protein
MGCAVGTVSFIEGFHGQLVYEGRACVNDFSRQGRFLGRGSASQLPSPLPRVSTARRYRSFLCRSHVEHGVTHSANEHSGLQRDSLAKLNRAACPRQSANQFGSSNRITRITELAVRLTRPAHHLLPGTLMLGYTGLNCQQSKTQGKVEAMRSSNISAGFGVKAFSHSAASCTGLTVGSTRTPILRIAPDRPYGRRLTWR